MDLGSCSADAPPGPSADYTSIPKSSSDQPRALQPIATKAEGKKQDIVAILGDGRRLRDKRPRSIPAPVLPPMYVQYEQDFGGKKATNNN